jgi:hypothetical protein
VDAWFDLLEECNHKTLSQKEFKRVVDAWAKEWARSTIEAQGHISEMIADRLMQ